MNKEDIFCNWQQNHMCKLQEEFSIHMKDEFDGYCRRRFEAEVEVKDIKPTTKWKGTI